VLFADVKGSMELAERLDPEEWHKIMDRFFQVLADGVYRFEGTVNQYTGDGIMALFGAPIAHEDHAQRACWAALHLTEALRHYGDKLRLARGLDFSVRMGLNSGEVVVGRIGDDLRMDYTAQGHAVGLAQRMEQLAGANRVCLTEHTARLVEGFFRLRDLGPLTVKGVRDPLRVYELEGRGSLRTKLDVSRARGFTRFVGRDEEVAALEAALARAAAGDGQVVGVVAEAGVGKSRLCAEFVQRCRARGISVHEARCVAHGKMVPYLPVLELLRGYFGIGEQDTAQDTREKIAGKILLLDPELTEALPLVFGLLGVPDPERPVPLMDPEAHQHRLLEAMKRLTYARSRREPGVSLIEDLHWIDGGSATFLENFVAALPGARELLLVTFRPEYHASWMQKSYYHQLPLAPLGSEALAALFRDLLGSDPALVGLAQRIAERTGGNPFFIEEVVQSLVEGGSLEGTRGAYRLVKPVERLALPPTVQAVLTARIDRLGEQGKTVLQTAAVIGKEFAEPILRRVAERPETDLRAALQTLVQAEFLYGEALYPEAVYTFKHPLTQEVAYRSLLGERRARVHRAVAEALEATSTEQPGERAALIAQHWEAAGEALTAARWLVRAAEWVWTSHLAEALRHWARVRALVLGLPQSTEQTALAVAACTQMLDLGWRLGLSEDETARLFADGAAMAERSGDLRSLGWLHAHYGTVRGYAGDEEGRVKHAREALRLAAETAHPTLEVFASVTLMFALLFLGRLREALSFAEPAAARALSIEPADTTVMPVSDVQVHWARGVILFHMGRLDDGRRELDRTLAMARERGITELLGWTRAYCSSLAWFAGDGETALLEARAALETGEKIGSAYICVLAHAMVGGAHILRGEMGEATSVLERGLTLARERGAGRRWEAHILAQLADARLLSGDEEGARTLAEEAVAAARRGNLRLFETLAQIVLARVVRRTQGAAGRLAIETALARAHALVEETDARCYQPFVHVERAELARLAGDTAACAQELREAHRLFTEMGAPTRAEQVSRELGSSVESASGISSMSRT
jgi:class 3 adenylate cyclase